jgi:hypothetical protein
MWISGIIACAIATSFFDAFPIIKKNGKEQKSKRALKENEVSGNVRDLYYMTTPFRYTSLSILNHVSPNRL